MNKPTLADRKKEWPANDSPVRLLERGQGRSNERNNRMPRPVKYDTDALITALRTLAHRLETNTLSKQDVENDPNFPSAMTFIRRFGSWSEAVAAAGLEPQPRGRPAASKPFLMPRKKPWPDDDPLEFPETNRISNDAGTMLANELVVWQGHELTPDFLRSMDEDARDEIAKDLLNFFLRYDWSRCEYAADEIRQSWQALRRFSGKVQQEDGTPYIRNCGTSGYKIYRHFFSSGIVRIRNANRRSVHDVLSDKRSLWAVIRNRIGNTLLYGKERNSGLGALQYPMPITPSQIIIGAKNSGLASMGSIFQPSLAKTVYERYVKHGDAVLDYSAGFGTRLLGLMACRNAQYAAYEPNSDTHANLIRMAEWFGFDAQIKRCGSETGDLFDQRFDFAFSSPPYFDFERYCDEESQCYNRYPEYDEWLERYWRRTVANCGTMLKPDGVFGVNIGGSANRLMRALARDLTRVVEEEGFLPVETIFMRTGRSHLSSKKDSGRKFKLEGLYFYRKGPA